MEVKKLFGREKERALIDDHYTSKESSLIAIIGRRRIGKTYLVRRALENKIDFELVGSQNGSRKEQLQNFQLAIMKYAKSNILLPTPSNWIEAFHQLEQLLSLKGKKKKVIFLDEFPWINTPKSGFVEVFAHFWNRWASENNVMIVVCGSAATWMLKNVVNGRGGLHNRISQTILLKPFQLEQTKQMVTSMGVKATDTQMTELYMVFGGVPYYISLLEKNKSIYQNIDNLLLSENGRLKNEYQNLLPSLFDNAANHLAILNVLASKWKGLNRADIATIYKNADGGGLTKVLQELEQTGFISSYLPFRKAKKDTLYRISDAYTLFYLKFLKQNRMNSFMDIAKSANYRVWCGYAFENICLQHITKIQDKLGISKIQNVSSSYLYKGGKDETGFQYDLLIERADNVINVCEMKYHNTSYTFDKKTYQKIKDSLAKFQEIVGSKTVLHYTMVTTYGCIHNEYYLELVTNEVLLKDFY